VDKTEGAEDALKPAEETGVALVDYEDDDNENDGDDILAALDGRQNP
jgi:hypothetical protein